MVVNQIARLTGVPPHVVRYYSRIGLLNPGRNPANGYKTFTPEDVARLRFIRLARRLGYSLTDISALLTRVCEGGSVGPSMEAMLRRHLAETAEQMVLLGQQLASIERALGRWRDAPGDTADLTELCGFLQTLLDERTPEVSPERRVKPSLGRHSDS